MSSFALALIAQLACTAKPTPADSVTDSAADSAVDSGDPIPLLPNATISGTLTIAVDIHPEYEWYWSDCSFTFTFEGERYLERPWLCPSCDLIFAGEARVDEETECQVTYHSLDDAPRGLSWTQEIGLSLSDGVVWMPLQPNRVYRSWQSGLTLTEGAEIVLDMPLSVPSSDREDHATYQLSGQLEYAVDPDSLIEDPQAARGGGPYACGWPRNNPGDLTRDYHLAVGQTFPNLRLRDQCGEDIDTWDFYGSWIVLDSAQANRSASQRAAAEGQEALMTLRDAGHDVRYISLLTAITLDPASTPTEQEQQEWVEASGLTDPVLADEGAGLALLGTFLEPHTGQVYALPATVVIDPEMKLVDGFIGESGWAAARALIEQADGG